MLFNLASWGHMLTNPHFTFVYFNLVLKDALFNNTSFHYPCLSTTMTWAVERTVCKFTRIYTVCTRSIHVGGKN